MKRLTIVRHGKSSWDLNVRDHDRVLAQRGIDDGHLIGDQLKTLNLNPDQAWTSTAARALQTATLVMEYLDYKLDKLKFKRDLYTFEASQLKAVVQNCADDIDHLMIFSHNHGITDFVNTYGSERFDNVPTTGVVMIEFKIDHWKELNQGNTVFHLFPKALR